MPECNDANAAPATAPVPGTNGAIPAAKANPVKKHIEPKDSNREFLETVVFVVFLVLLLKAFVAEAFVIPTGSMATTLLGDHADVICEKCKYPYSVNAQSNNRLLDQVTAICPNCRHEAEVRPVSATGGDKVLVFKSRYDVAKPSRHDVIVFKFPGQPGYLPSGHGSDRRDGGPQKDYIAYNYIKRLWGIPGDRLAIWYGDVYLRLGEGDQERLAIIRRTPDKYISMRRLVNHNDFIDATLTLPRRWQDEAETPAWKADGDGKAFQLEPADAWSWLSYRNILRSTGAPEEKDNRLPQLITDFLEYNSSYSYNWTPDLMIEFEVNVNESTGQLVAELAGGVDLHRATFNLSDGGCTLQTLREGEPLAFVDEQGQKLDADKAQASTKLGKTGKHTVRFCSFDQRLTLWVDGKLIFGDGLVFPAPSDEQRGPRLADLRPVRIGATQAKLKVSSLQVYRDVYYTREASHHDVGSNHGLSLSSEERSQLLSGGEARLNADERRLSAEQRERLIAHRARPEKWSAYFFRGGADAAMRMDGPKHYPTTHPDHHPEDRLGPDEYFALGDNSTQSSDSRAWGPIPERLLLGKAVSVYWPLPSRFGLIR